MAQFKINIPDEKLGNYINAFAVVGKYQAQIQDANGDIVDNPMSKARFAKNMVKSYFREVYVAAQVKILDEERRAIIEAATIETSDINVE